MPDIIRYSWHKKMFIKLHSDVQGMSVLFEWIIMIFGLKNAGATYQRAMNYIFHEIIGKIVEIYIDDVVVKSKGHREHIANLHRTLKRTRKHGLKMNPNKCAFDVPAGLFFGFYGPRKRD